MLKSYIFTDKGERSVNEDCVGSCETNFGKIFILCDGLGGHGKGDEASQLVVSFIKSYAETAVPKDNESFVNGAVVGAQNTLLQFQKEQGFTSQSKTTLTLLIVNNNNTATIAHIGDSRVYQFKNNKYVFRTYDHSVPQTLFKSGEIREKDIRHHEDRNRLLRCMGNEWYENKGFEIDMLDQPFDSGDAFLMCSDGFWDWILERDMEKALKKNPDIMDCGDALVQKAIKRGKGKNMDNFSVIIVRV